MALSRGCSLPLMSPYGLPAAGSVGSHPPGCLTLRAAYAAYRATALLLGSQPAPAGMCSSFRFPVSGFRFQVSSLCPSCFSRSKFRLQFSPSVLSVSSVVKSMPKKNWPNGQVVKIGIGLMKKGRQYNFCLFEEVTTAPSSNEDPPSPSTHARPRGRSGIDFAHRAGSARGDLLLGFQRLHIRLWHGRRHLGGTHHK